MTRRACTRRAWTHRAWTRRAWTRRAWTRRACAARSGAWLARSLLPLHVGEVACLLSTSRGDLHMLLLDTGASFVLPDDIAGAARRGLVPGDMVCVRTATLPDGRLVAASIDGLDGVVSLASAWLDGAPPSGEPPRLRRAPPGWAGFLSRAAALFLAWAVVGPGALARRGDAGREDWVAGPGPLQLLIVPPTVLSAPMSGGAPEASTDGICSRMTVRIQFAGRDIETEAGLCPLAAAEGTR